MGRNKSKTMGNFSLMGNNANGLRNKLESLQNNVAILKPSVITIQETRLLKRGMIVLPGYQIFEKSGGWRHSGVGAAFDVNMGIIRVMIFDII